ncbi:MAG: glycosyltransferase, partial [Ruminococcus sp.]
MRKKKLLHIVEAMGGGVFTYIVELSNQLVEKYDIYIAYATRPQTPENFRDYFDDRIKLIEVENFSRSVNALSDVKAFFEIKNIVKKINPDVVHLHSSKAGALGRWCINGRKIPMFYTPHGFSFL